MNKRMGEMSALYFIKLAIDGQRLSRFTLGHELYQGHRMSNRWRRKPQSVTSYITLISIINPTMSKRTLMRHYRVYEKLIVRTGLSEFTLIDIDFTTLAIAAEDRDLNPPALRDIMDKLHTMLENGASQKDVRKQLRVYAERNRANIPRLIALIEECDEWIVSGMHPKDKEHE